MRQSFEMDTLLGFANVAADNPEAEVPLWSELGTDYDTGLIDHEGKPGSYVPNADQPEGSVPIFIDRWPEGPDDVVVIADYTVSDDPASSDSVIGVQVSVRCADLDKVKGITSDLFALFQGRWGGMLGRVTLVSARRASGTNTGQDSNDRQGRTENYYLTVHRPSTHRQ